MNLEQANTNPRFFTQNIAHLHTFYISGTITEPENYIQELETIRSATENDIVRIIINSGGGDLMTGMQLRSAIMSSSAHIQTVVEGQCASAATMIFLAGHELVAEPHSMFMFHNYSGGTFGKGGEMHEQISFERRWSIDFLTDVYKDFLTKSELSAMLDGKDFWFTGKEVMDRIIGNLEKKQKKAQADAERKAKSKAKPKKSAPTVLNEGE